MAFMLVFVRSLHSQTTCYRTANSSIVGKLGAFQSKMWENAFAVYLH